MLKNNDEAREYFKPLTYDDLTEKNFNKLVAILEEHLGKWNRKVLEDREEHGHDNRYYMTIYQHKKYGKYPGTRFVEKNGVKEAFIIVKCDNYSVRGGISFNKDGFIGFAGWSDSTNVKPFLDAFEEWVGKIKIEKFGIPAKVTEISPISKEEIQKHRQALYNLLDKGIPMEKSLALTPEQAFGMTTEQYDTYINSYYVNELPKNPELGRLVCMDNVEYVYTKDGWCKININESKLAKIKDIVKNMEDCNIKTELSDILL